MKRFWVTFLFFGLFSFGASADFDVTCFEENCWNHGWTVLNPQTGHISESTCVGNSCFENGWIERSQGRFVSETECIDNACWTHGFDTFNRDGHWAGGIRCNEDPNLGPNCLTAGWKVINYQSREVSTATCIAGDCERYGWDIEFGNGAIQIVRCKDGACFTNGWTLRP